MPEWMSFSLIAVALWGVVGLLQKIATNHISADSVLIWDRVGYLVLLPWFLGSTQLQNMSSGNLIIGILAGTTNGLGAWFLYKCLESGANASIAVPLTSLYPLLTVMLAVVFLGERPRPLQWIGIALAMVAGALMSSETLATEEEVQVRRSSQ
jgi:bacterial/archaeal transporter family protein